MRSFQLLEATAAERALFADLDRVLALPAEMAGPRNRLRHVLRVVDGGRTWYLKCFARTQWRNRLRFRCTAPRATDDAHREAAVSAALRAAGIEAPRPVLVARDGARSWYLCAALPGAPFAELLAAGAVEPALARAAAMFCGDVLRRGFWLPDLSADHLFVRREVAMFHFGLIDLHNATCAPPGTPPRWVVRRLLRRFRRSIGGLPVPPRPALRFAVRLLRAAGHARAVRRLLAGLPPLHTALRYERAGRSTAYLQRNRRRDAAERALLQRVWPGRPGESVLDAPCGTGRLQPLLQTYGHRVLQVDGAMAMLREARAADQLTALAVRGDALHLPFADRAVDGAVCFRFLHHLTPDLAADAIGEACRVSRRFLVLSFFQPWSLHHAQRTLRRWWRRLPARRHALTQARVRALCAAHGFQPLGRCRGPWLRDLRVAAFVRGSNGA